MAMGEGVRMTHEFDTCPAKPRIELLEKNDRDQNGSLQRIEAKVDRILFTIVAGLGAVVLALIGTIASGVLR